jgi:hypothetical protein
VISEIRVRALFPAIAALGMLVVPPAIAQEATTEELLESAVPQEERICDLEIAEVEARLDENIDAFGRMEQARMRDQLREAREFCDDGNQMMAAIRLEAVTAVLDVTAAAD